MAAKTICDACRKDMTDEPARLAFDQDRPFSAHANPHHEPRIPLRIITTAHQRADDGGSIKADVCVDCIRRAVADGSARDLGPVTRGGSS